MSSPEALDPALHRLLAACSERLSDMLGLDLPRRRWPELARALEAVARETECADVGECVERLLAGAIDAEALETLIHRLTIGETYFFRDPAVFAALREHILPPLVRARGPGAEAGRRLRIWSAGCSTGEEAYSIAMTLQEYLPEWERWHITLLASDVDRHALAAARQGVYPEWSFRATSGALKARHFQRLPDGRYRIAERLRAMVSFVPLNLAEDVYPAVETNTTAMDLIFCRNVLMYLQPAHVRRVVARLERSLCEGGLLAVSAVEAGLAASPALVSERLPGALLLRKRRAAPADAQRTAAGGVPGLVLPSAARPGRLRAESDGVAKAAALHAEGRYAEVARLLERRLGQRPGDVEAMRLLARALANAGQLDAALAWCERALALRPLDATGAYLRGSILPEQARPDEAAAAFRRSLYLEPDFALAEFALGNALAGQGQHQRAAGHYRRALTGLRKLPPDQSLAEADDLSAGRLVGMIEALLGMEAAA